MIAPRVDPIQGRASRRASKKRSSDAVAATQDPSRSRLDSGSTAILLDTGQRQEMIRKQLISVRNSEASRRDRKCRTGLLPNNKSMIG